MVGAGRKYISGHRQFGAFSMMICKICDTQVFGNICYSCANEVAAPPPVELNGTQRIVADLQRARAEHVEWEPEFRVLRKPVYAGFQFTDYQDGLPVRQFAIWHMYRDGHKEFAGYEY